MYFIWFIIKKPTHLSQFRIDFRSCAIVHWFEPVISHVSHQFNRCFNLLKYMRLCFQHCFSDGIVGFALIRMPIHDYNRLSHLRFQHSYFHVKVVSINQRFIHRRNGYCHDRLNDSLTSYLFRASEFHSVEII